MAYCSLYGNGSTIYPHRRCRLDIPLDGRIAGLLAGIAEFRHRDDYRDDFCDGQMLSTSG
jgi:hypothetical protein